MKSNTPASKIDNLFSHSVNLKYISSVPNSSSGLIFVKIRAESGQMFSKNPGKIRVNIWAKLKLCDLVVFL